MATVDAVRFLLSRRWLVFLGAVVVLAYLAFRLGEWQFHRLDEREAHNAVVERNLDAPPVPVQRVLAVDDPVDPQDEWRHVTARGEYAEDRTVIVRYQTHEGQSGVDVVTPLVTEDGTALLVNRGWLATDDVGITRADVPAAPSGTVDVAGWVRADAGGADSATVRDGSTRAISSTAIAETVPFPLYRGFVELDTESPPAAEPLTEVDPPDLGEGPHFFYGLQWWFFGLLALVGFGYLVWDERRRRLRDRAEEGATSPGPAHEESGRAARR